MQRNVAIHSLLRGRRRPTSILFVSVLLSFVSTGRADDRYWVGTDSNWDNPLNWSDTPGGSGGAGVPFPSDNVYLFQTVTPDLVVPLTSQYSTLNALYIGGTGSNPVTVLQADQTFFTLFTTLGWLGPGAYHQAGGQYNAYFLQIGGSTDDDARAGTYLLSGGDLSSQHQVLGDFGNAAPGLLRQTGGTNTTVEIDINPTGRYELVDGQFSSQILTLTGRFDQTGGDHVTNYLNIGDSGEYHWSAGTLRVSQGLSVYGAFEFPATPATFNPDGLVILANPAALANTHNVHLVLGPNSVLIHPAGFDPAAAFASYTNAGLDHALGTPFVIPAGTSIISGGAITDPLDLYGSLAGNDTLEEDLVLFNHFTLRPGGTLGDRAELNVNIVPGAGTSRILGGTLNARGIYTSFSYDNLTSTATFLQSGGTVTLGALSLGAASFYELSGGSLTVLDGASLAGTYTAEPRAEFHQTGGTFTVRSLSVEGGSQRGALFSIAGGSFMAQTVMVGETYVTSYPLTSQFDIAGPAADIHIGALTLARNSRLTAVPGSTIHLASLSISSTDPSSLPGLANLHLLFDAPAGTATKFEVASADLGPTSAGFDTNFAVATLELGSPDGLTATTLTLLNIFDNNPALPTPDALYVRDLVLNPNTVLDLNGLHLYYDHLVDNGGTILPNGGLMLQVPEPVLLTPATLCLAAGAARRRRRPTSRRV